MSDNQNYPPPHPLGSWSQTTSKGPTGTLVGTLVWQVQHRAEDTPTLRHQHQHQLRWNVQSLREPPRPTVFLYRKGN